MLMVPDSSSNGKPSPQPVGTREGRWFGKSTALGQEVTHRRNADTAQTMAGQAGKEHLLQCQRAWRPGEAGHRW